VSRVLGDSHHHLFVVGCARTGSTLLRHVLNRSPQVVILPETHFMRRMQRLKMEAMPDGALGEEPDRVVERLYRTDNRSRTGYWAWLRRNVPSADLAERLRAGDGSMRSLFATLIDLYVERAPHGMTATVVGEKTPSHLAFVPTLRSWFPDAIVVHTFRDPRAIFASELRRRREGRWGPKRWLRWLTGPAADALLVPMELVRTAIVWRRADDLDMIYRRQLGDAYRLVRFEDLVADPQDELKEVCRLIGVPFDPRLLEVDVIGSSYDERRHGAVGFDPAAAQRWRAHVGPLSRRWFRLVLGRRMRARGYAP
jgi:hypothetical protein